MIDCGGQPVSGQFPLFGEQCPRVQDCLLFEIISKREIPEHFKECVMPRSIADIVEIIMLTASTDAFLGAGRAVGRRRFEPGKGVLERHHARIDEHERWVIIRHEWRARNLSVPSPGKIVEE